MTSDACARPTRTPVSSVPTWLVADGVGGAAAGEIASATAAYAASAIALARLGEPPEQVIEADAAAARTASGWASSAT